jgi:hypothetical protein
VFLHCTSGVSRAPTVFLCYLALFLRHDHWKKNKNCEELRKFLEFNYKFASPNMEIVEKVFTEGYDSVEQERLKALEAE